MAHVSDAAAEAVTGRQVRRDLAVSVTLDGHLDVRRAATD
jgi:transcriptional regulator